MRRAALYLRVSTAEQTRRAHSEEGYSIEAQREAGQRKAGQLEAEIADEYVDRGESARSADRPELQRLLSRLRDARDLDYVIVHKLDRLARSVADHLAIAMAIREAGAELISVVESIDDTPLGQYMETIFAANAQLYSANLSHEAKKGLHKKAQLGGTPCAAPIGYLNIRKQVEGREIRTVEVDPARAPHIRWAFTAYASGAYTLDTLEAALRARGLVTRPTPTRPAKPLSRAQVARMLAHPYYVGTVRYAGAEYPGKHEPLVDGDTFSRAQAVLTAHANSKEKDRKHHHYLKGSLVCALCGSNLTFVKARGKMGTLYPYFACIGRIKGTGCRLPYVPADAVEEKVIARYAAIKFEQAGAKSAEQWVAHLDDVKSALEAAVAGMRKLNEREVRRQRRRIGEIKAKQRKLLDAYLADSLPIALLQEKQASLARELGEAEQLLGLAEQDALALGTALAQAIDLARDCGGAYAGANGSTRRQWNQAFFQQFKVNPGGIDEARLTEDFQLLTDRDTPRRLRAESRVATSSRRGSNETLLAGIGTNTRLGFVLRGGVAGRKGGRISLAGT